MYMVTFRHRGPLKGWNKNYARYVKEINGLIVRKAGMEKQKPYKEAALAHLLRLRLVYAWREVMQTPSGKKVFAANPKLKPEIYAFAQRLAQVHEIEHLRNATLRALVEKLRVFSKAEQDLFAERFMSLQKTLNSPPREH